MLDSAASVWCSWIGGEWLASGTSLPVVDPSTGEQFATVACAGTAEVDAAVRAANVAFETSFLRTGHPRRRAELLYRVAQEIRLLREEGARMLCRESGKALRDAYDEFDEAVRYFEYYAGMADKLEGKSIPLGEDLIDFTFYEPFGVSAQIIPWNFPVSLCGRSLAPALAAGNAVVLKSPELAPLGLVYIAKACENAGMPAGQVNLLCGLGTEAGAALVGHPGIHQIVFTGSVQTGQAILRAAAERAVPCVMELGGKSAGIVHADADLSEVVDSVRSGIFLNAGQVCSAMSRLLIHESIYEETLDRISQLVAGFTVGAGIDNADLTPVISGAQLGKIEQMCKEARDDGAVAVCGGGRIERKGFFFAPTVFRDVAQRSRIAQEEVFGPVLATMAFGSEDEAYRLANDSRFGLVAGVFTRDLGRAMRAAQRLDAGQVFVNRWFAGGIETPFGGRKLSGYGREKGIEALYNYVQTKNVAVSVPRAV